MKYDDDGTTSRLTDAIQIEKVAIRRIDSPADIRKPTRGADRSTDDRLSVWAA
jgi:hypothetical protein